MQSSCGSKLAARIEQRSCAECAQVAGLLARWLSGSAGGRPDLGSEECPRDVLLSVTGDRSWHATPEFSLKQSRLAGVGGRSWLETAPTRPAPLAILALDSQRARSREHQGHRDTCVASPAVSHHSREPARGQVAGLEGRAADNGRPTEDRH